MRASARHWASSPVARASALQRRGARVAILVARRDHQHAGERHVGIRVHHSLALARIAKRGCDDLGETEPSRRLPQHDEAASEDSRPASKVAVSGLAPTGDRPDRTGVAFIAVSWRLRE